MVEITKIIEIGNQFLLSVRLPAAHTVTDDTAFAKNYAIIAQILDKTKKGQPLNEFQKKNYPAAIENLAAGRELPPLDSEHIPDWIEWLKAIPEMAAIMAKREATAAGAKPLLKFLLRLTELQDMDGLEKSDGKQIYPLQRLRKGPPNSIIGCTEAILAFAQPGKKANTFQVLMYVTLAPRENEGFGGRPGPSENSQMVVNDTRFFDADGEPMGDYDADKIADVTARAWPLESLATWDGFMAEVDQRCREMFGGDLHEFPQIIFGNHAPTIAAFIVDRRNITPSMWVSIYKDMIEGLRDAPAVDAAIDGHPENKELHHIRLTTSPRADFLGHMDTRQQDKEGKREAYPLDSSQRLAAVSAVTLGTRKGECILPVNGPPGTGKTSFLRGVLASMWVKAALDQAPHPPVVYGTGATNKAVSNVIEAFSEVQNNDKEQFNGRWLEGLPSYGWFYPSREAAKNFPDYMHLQFNDGDKNPFSPAGAAEGFRNIPLVDQISLYRERGQKALGMPPQSSVGDIVKTLHIQISDYVRRLHDEQSNVEKWLHQVPSVWESARGTAGRLAKLKQGTASKQHEIAEIGRQMAKIENALELGKMYQAVALPLNSGWRARIPESIRRWWWKKPLEDIDSTAARAGEAFRTAGVAWSPEPTLLQKAIADMERAIAGRRSQRGTLAERNTQLQEQREEITAYRAQRQRQWASLKEKLYTQRGPGEMASVKYAAMLCDQDPEKKKSALAILIARMEAHCDLKYRIPLFHLAARYWEGRWIMAQETKENKTDAIRIHELMMLGVIIVATTHKLCSLGKKVPADTLIMDEAGQCAPEVAIGALALTRSAILVGDTKQLQPVNTLAGVDTIRQIAYRVGITPDQLPDAFNPRGGSGMAVAQRAAAVADGTGDPGVTLLFHYRCHPKIIAYCNSLLYEGKIIPVRTDKPNPSGMPPMSWVDVEAEEIATGGKPSIQAWQATQTIYSGPVKVGSSWKNQAEIDAIIAWIKDAHADLVAAYQKPLDQILAIITPLAAQAHAAEKAVKTGLQGILEDHVIKNLIVGTVHRLQGAERPIVAFSLVQHTSKSTSLFADRDGGFLMNVAVSRAKDSFVIFAQRRTLAPTAADQKNGCHAQTDGPVGFLGRYLRDNGTRLYPRSLVVIEAPGKTRAIQRALGLRVAVIATSGHIKTSKLASDGGLRWSSAPASFVEKIHSHRGLVDDLVIATDDDIAGELIGLHAAEVAAEALGPMVPVRRMRFYDLTPQQLKSAFKNAGRDFDAAMLAAALLREMARHHDQEKFREAMPKHPYMSAQQRDAMQALSELSREDGKASVRVDMPSKNGGYIKGFVVEESSALARPAIYAEDEAETILRKLRDHVVKTGDMEKSQFRQIEQIPRLYPPTTTARILAIAVDECKIKPWVTQAHLNALYQEGAAHE